MRRNVATTLRRRHRTDPMARFDTLPAPLRRWLHGAALPWSAASALRLWRAALRESGDPAAALARLDHVEARKLAQDARRIWGGAYPAHLAPGVRR